MWCETLNRKCVCRKKLMKKEHGNPWESVSNEKLMGECDLGNQWNKACKGKLVRAMA